MSEETEDKHKQAKDQARRQRPKATAKATRRPRRRPRRKASAKKAASAEGAGGRPKRTRNRPAGPAPPPRLIAHFREKVVPGLEAEVRLQERAGRAAAGEDRDLDGPGQVRHRRREGQDRAGGEGTGVIAGQKPVRCKAKKSVANFKVREGQETGLKVTLRGSRMYEFLDRLITLAIPRVKDFRGLIPDGFDKNGNYNFGFTEQTVFPEVNARGSDVPAGHEHHDGDDGAECRRGPRTAKQFGFPFRTDEKDRRSKRS